jgi:hypothetical protein
LVISDNISNFADEMRKITFNKKNFILGFGGIVALLALVRLVFPQVANAGTVPLDVSVENTDNNSEHHEPSTAFMADYSKKSHTIRGVSSYAATFPDSQAVQIVAANRWGVTPVRNRADAEHRKKELVYVGESPYYHVDPLYSSIPYLVPRAAVLLQDIGQAFYDSLYVKGIPLNKLIVTSVLRSMDDVAKLRRRNPNATEQSCHLYGTTFDICYNRYHPVTQEVRNDTLKWVLSEVLRDMRAQERCYIKYEVKQGCFHMTVR